MTDIPIRNARFSLDDVPRAWLGGRRAVSIWFDNMSTLFPLGERFFVQTVKHYMPMLEDPALREAAQQFCGQEAMHGREHERYNDRSRSFGYPVDRMEAHTKRLLGLARKVFTPRQQLGVTVALEHYTALMGHTALGHPGILADADATMRALWRWHAVEENEHKAVAFDVFQAVGGTYGERVGTMAITTLFFWYAVLYQQTLMMRAEGILGSVSEWRSLVDYLFRNPGGMGQMFVMAAEYFRRDFHPNDFDSAALLAEWRKTDTYPVITPKAAPLAASA